MYNRRTKIFFGVMAFLLLVGYPLSLLSGFSGFQNLFSGASSTNPTSIISTARKDIQKHPHDKGAVGQDLEKIGSAYLTLAGGTNISQSQSQQYLGNAVDAYTEWTKFSPGNTQAQGALANALGDNQDFAQAASIYRQLSFNKNVVDPSEDIFAWGSAASQANDTEGALTAFQRYLKVDPSGDEASTATQEIQSLEKTLAGGSGSTPTPAATPKKKSSSKSKSAASTTSTTSTNQTSTGANGTVTVG